MAPRAPARKKSAAKKPAKAAAKKAAKKTAPSAASAPPKKAPPPAAEVAAGEDSEVTTPVGTTGADVATNPDTTETDLQQPGTEPLMDPGTVKAVASEAETLQKGADPDKG
jgi:peroxiredoxin Q/BCP